MDGVSAEVIPYSLPFSDPYVTARGSLTAREMVLLRLRDTDGVVGLGEAVPLSLRGGATLKEVCGELEVWAEETRDPSEGLSAPSACAVRTAILDLESRRVGVPAWRALGARDARPVPCNATLPAGDPGEVAAQAAHWAQEGFSTFKLKVGTDRDAATVAAVRSEVGDGARIRIDANGMWSPAEAIAMIEELRAHDLELAEQPSSSLEDLAAVRRGTGVPVAADESVATTADARRAEGLAACDMATVKLSKVGGHDEALAIAAHLSVYLSSALDGPVGIAAAAHVAQTLRLAGDAGIAHGLATQRLFSDSPAAVECRLENGHLHLPGGNGLGVEIDEVALERCRL